MDGGLFAPWGGRLECRQLLHLNQAGVQHFICYLTDTHSGTLGHSHKGAAGSIPAVIERKRKRALGLRMPLPLP